MTNTTFVTTTIMKESPYFKYTCTKRKTLNQPFVVRQALPNKSAHKVTVLIHVLTAILPDL